jgi:ABC-type branched-subunit amino acid transport system ATPase component
MADSPTALRTSGNAVNVTRTLVFCLSAFMAAVGGAVVAAGQQSISSISYPPLLSLTYLVLVVISLGREPWYALMAAVLLIMVPSYLTDSDTTYWLQLGFGLAAVAYAVLPARALEVPAPVRRVLDGAFRRRAVPVVSTPVLHAQRTPAAAVGPGRLEVRDVTVAFGGNVAVKDFSLTASTGRITGLIGPNGAGKTTTFNACSGLVRPRGGDVLLDGELVTRTGVPTRARRGLGRTFQRMELFDSLSVRENVSIGWEGSRAASNPLSHLIARPKEKAAMRAATHEALALCELADLADQPVGSLSTGQRRLVELARCLAGPFRILLLDEPSSGLDRIETERFGAILRRVVEQRGVGVLLVEHDMALVMDVCDHIYVLDFGRPLFDGTPAEILASPLVRAAYLGDESAAELLTEGTPV